MKELKQAVEKQLEDGVSMSKQISGGGVFTSSVWDRRTVYSWEKILELQDEGFAIDGTNVGVIVLNAIMNYKEI